MTHDNPFNPVTTVRYRLPVTARVRIQVLDLLGKEVAVLADGTQDPGEKTVRFDGRGLSSGLYLCRMQAGEFTAARKILLLK